MPILYFFAAAMLASIAGLAGHGAFGACAACSSCVPVALWLVGLYERCVPDCAARLLDRAGAWCTSKSSTLRQPVTQGTAFVRLVVRGRAVVCAVPAAARYALAFVGWRGQTLHDKAVNCYVVNNPQGYDGFGWLRSPLPAVVAATIWSMPRSARVLLAPTWSGLLLGKPIWWPALFAAPPDCPCPTCASAASTVLALHGNLAPPGT